MLGWENAPEDVVNGDDATLPHQAQEQLKVARIAALVCICAPCAAPQELLRAARMSAATYPAKLSLSLNADTCIFRLYRSEPHANDTHGVTEPHEAQCTHQ